MGDKLISLAACADLLGVTPRTLQRFVAGKGSRGEEVQALPHEIRNGRVMVAPALVYAHLQAYGSERLKARLNPPPQHMDAETPLQVAGELLAPGAAVSIDLSDIEQTIRSLAGSDLKNDDKRTAIMFLELHRKYLETGAKLQQRLEPHEVVDMLRDLGAVYVSEVDISARTDAADLVQFIRDEFAVDLVERRANAVDAFEARLRERANRMIVSIRSKVDDQVAGVQDLEFQP